MIEKTNKTTIKANTIIYKLYYMFMSKIKRIVRKKLKIKFFSIFFTKIA